MGNALKNVGGRPVVEFKKARIIAVRLDSRLLNQFNAYLLTHKLKVSQALRKAIKEMIEKDTQ
ncbi:MAG: hypothetical protein PHT30_05600 [Bacilli bacterium]|jgi:uncharacterized protein (DUF4415 family)|nr:hypothetical protein [Bacilli bacterium]